MKSLIGVLLHAFVLMMVLVTPAHAYVDPGTGAMILQMIGAAVAGTLFFFHSLRDRIRGWFSRSREKPAAEQASAEGDSDSTGG